MQGQSDRVYVNIDIPADKKVIITWDRKVGLESKIRSGNMLGTYAEVGNPDATKVKIKAPISGKVIMLEPPGTEISPLKVCVMEKCKHDVQVGKLCTFCGVQVLESQNDSVGFVHKAFALSHEKAKEIYEDLEVKMLSSKKLFLVLDLDNTLIHAEIIKHHSHLVEKIDLGFNPEEEGLKTLEFYRDKFVVKLRPFLEEFLAALSPKYLVHIYTKGTRDYAEEILRQVDPKGIYVSQERLISRNEMGENQFKSIKKVIHDGSLALILDDRSDVWGSIKNLVYTQPYHIFEIIQGKLMIIRRADVFLYMIKDVLGVIHELFYLFFARGDRIKVYEIYHTIRRNLFAKERIAFFGLFQTEEDLKKSREYKSLRKLGAASIDLEPTKETTLIFSRLSSKIKTYPVTEVPVVSLWYIYYCEMYCTHLNPADFDLREPDTVIRVLEKSIHKSADEKNVAKDQMEDYLMKKESNKGGMEIIRDVVIRKLEDRNNEKEIARDESEDDADILTKKVKVDANGEIFAKEVNNIVESEEDHNIRDLNQDGGDNQEVLDKEVNLVQHYLNE